MNIMHLNLRRIDLNLLLVFEAVYRLRSVTRAAAELALSTSALSHALTRLRKSLSDELFYRVGNDMLPTVFAESLAPAIGESLTLLTKGLNPRPPFLPATSRETFTFAITDYTAFAVFPMLMAHLQEMAPHISFQLCYSERKVALNDLLAGKIDFALGFTESTDEIYPEIEEIDWLEDDYVAICSPIFTQKYGALTQERYLQARHVVVTPWNEQRGVIDYQLEKQGLQRDIALKTPSLLGSPFIIAASELLMSIPHYAARQLQRSAALEIHPLPFTIPAYTIKIYLHRKNGRPAACNWLKQQFTELATGWTVDRIQTSDALPEQ
ncbi:LysR family transcriptional regulator [Edaphovirga cremea]|uniref:LysR family transcriptional regulator n=1 Tax=Edaphovirga cremea TaxID=2267246 RepID=UPI0039897B4F